MADKPKVTADMIAGKEKVPEGYQLKQTKHKAFFYTNAKGKRVDVKAHDEFILIPIKPKVEEKPKAATKKNKK